MDIGEIAILQQELLKEMASLRKNLDTVIQSQANAIAIQGELLKVYEAERKKND